MLANLLSDIRYGLRGFAKRPGFAVVVVATLAIGIGLNVAMHSIFESLLLRPVPARDPGSLVNLAAPGPKPGFTACNIAGDCTNVFSYPMYRDLEREQQPFTGIAAHRVLDANLAFGGGSQAVDAMLVSGNYFELLGVQPALGRLLGPQDDETDGVADAVVLGYAYWRDRRGADPNVLGKTLVVNGKPLTIVGVAPRGFFGTSKGIVPEVYVPITFRWLEQPRTLPDHGERRSYWVYLFARLKPGISLAQAATAINVPYQAILVDREAALQTELGEQALAQFRTKTITVSPGALGQTLVRNGVATLPLTLLLLATLTVLLIACVNIANVMMARGAQRIGEMAVRASMGAGPLRLAALLLAESIPLTLIAAGLSLPIALATLRAIETTLLPEFATEAFDADLNARMVVLAFVMALVCTAVFSVLPAVTLARAQPADVLRSHGTRATAGTKADRFRSVLVVGQIALSMTLLVFAGLLAQSLTNVLRADLGLRTESLFGFSVSPALNAYSAAQSSELFDRLEEELGALPGVETVASSAIRLLAGEESRTGVEIEGFQSDPDANTDVDLNYVGAGFFDSLGLPLIAGRGFTGADLLDRPAVAVVNRRFVEHFGLGDRVLGQRVGMALREGERAIEIVGIVADAKYDNVKDPVGPQLFRPRRQNERLGSMTFYVRSRLDPEALANAVRALVAAHDPELPITNFLQMSEQIRENVLLDRFTGVLASAMAVLATLLAALGLYGVLSYTIAQRTAELGLRMALGAAPARLRGMVLGQVGRMGLVGGVLGLVAAVLLARAASALLYGVSAADWRVLGGAVLVLSLVVFGASYWPARRASRVDPMVALRGE